jgi:hypothetical protein
MEDHKANRLFFRLRAGLQFGRRQQCRAMLAAAIVVAAILGIDANCRADLVITAPNLTVDPGSSGSFDVLITSTGGTFNVASDIVELSLNGLSGVTFTGVSINTSTPYIYGSDSAALAGSTFTISTFPGTTFETFDFLNGLGAQTIAPGQSFGLVNVQYSVAADAVAGASGTLTFGPDTSFADASGNAVTADTPNGSITIFAASVPEPSGLSLLAIGSAAAVVYSVRKRSAKSTN